MIDFSRNHFELFGLAPRFRLDTGQLDRAYRELQSDVHPDRHAAGSEADQRVALQSSSHVNEAYRTLKDPVARAEYLLALHGARGEGDSDRTLPLPFLEEQLERRERASEAVESEDGRALDALLREVRNDMRERDKALADLLDRDRNWDEARVRVRELKFLAKLADDVDSMMMALEE
jgi:molecular chaperone HscB